MPRASRIKVAYSHLLDLDSSDKTPATINPVETNITNHFRGWQFTSALSRNRSFANHFCDQMKWKRKRKLWVWVYEFPMLFSFWRWNKTWNHLDISTKSPLAFEVGYPNFVGGRNHFGKSRGLKEWQLAVRYPGSCCHYFSLKKNGDSFFGWWQGSLLKNMVTSTPNKKKTSGWTS